MMLDGCQVVSTPGQFADNLFKEGGFACAGSADHCKNGYIRHVFNEQGTRMEEDTGLSNSFAKSMEVL